MVIPVEDAADARLADYVRLRDVDLRRSVESERGLFVAEGEKVIRRAIGAGHPVRSVLTTAKWLDALADVVGGTTVYLVSDEVMEGSPVSRCTGARSPPWNGRNCPPSAPS